jgi:HEAT repeat protein
MPAIMSMAGRPLFVLAAALTCGSLLTLAGCRGKKQSSDPLAAIAAELDAVVAGRSRAGNTRIRKLLGHEWPEARALAAQAAAAAGDWQSMPLLIPLLEDDARPVRARSAAAIAVLIGRDHAFDPDSPPPERARFRRHIERSYEELRANPPPRYRE